MSTRPTAPRPRRNGSYDNTFKNATSAKLDGEVVQGAYGGIPFPIPKSGKEIVANNELHWRGEAWQADFRGYLGTAAGQRVLSVEGVGDFQMPYYAQGQDDKFSGDYWLIRLVNSGPPVRAGEAITRPPEPGSGQDQRVGLPDRSAPRAQAAPMPAATRPRRPPAAWPASTRLMCCRAAPTASTGRSSASRRC